MIDLTSLIFTHGEEIKTNSLKVSEAFGKRHADVLRSIEQVLTQVSDSFGKRNFAFSEYTLQNNLGLDTKLPMYELTKDGFIMVVMSFTGEKAMRIKEAYIEAFNIMWEELYGRDHEFRMKLEAASTSFLITEAEKMNQVKHLSYFKRLQEKRIIFKRGNSKWMPSEKGLKAGLVELKLINPEYPPQLHLTPMRSQNCQIFLWMS